MRSPKDMEVIQIEITNACVNTCSNCTRFCGHHKKPYFMDFDMFKRAVDSLEGYTGVVGLMGGEPTLHPMLEEFTRYLDSKFKTRGNLKASRKPLKDFLTYTRAKHNANRVLNKCAGPGLWTSITKKYYEHYELIQDIFTFQNLNDHSKASYHHPLLVSRKELDISDSEFYKLRDKCWIQNCWSASITPKGAFFCEMAASLDMLFNGSGGWPIEKGWWEITPEQFGEQLKWCEICGGALTTFRRDANEGITDVTPFLYKKLSEIESPLLKKGKVKVFDKNTIDENREAAEFKANQYIDDFSSRMNDSAKHLKGMPIECIALEDGINFGYELYKIIEKNENDWFLLYHNESDEYEQLAQQLKELYLNKGVVYIIDENAFLFNKKSYALRRFGYDRILKSQSAYEIIDAYDKDKIMNIGGLDLSKDILKSEEIDELEWQKHIDNDFLKTDKAFKAIFEGAVESAGIQIGDKVVITQTASYFLTRGLITLLKHKGLNVFLISHKRFADKFEDMINKEDILIFDSTEAFNFESLKPELDKLLEKHEFSGAVIPYSVPRSVIVDEDGYQDIEKCVNYITDNVIARVNLKRQFVNLDFDINGDAFKNQWKY